MKQKTIQLRRLPLVATAAVLFVVAALATSSLAAPPIQPPQNYSGSLTHADFTSCSGALLNPPAYSIAGTWVLRVDPITQPNVLPSANLTLLVFRDGANYQLFPNIELTPISFANGVYHYSLGPGSNVTVTFDTNTGIFSWDVVFADNCTRRNYRSLSYVGIAH